MKQVAIGIGAIILTAVPIILYIRFYRLGNRFALRDKLRPADAMVAVAGTRGRLDFLEAKVCTAVRLYQAGWAPRIIFTGRFSRRVNDTPRLISRAELEEAAMQGRIGREDIPGAAETWDLNLGAAYMRDKAISLGVPDTAITTEENALHTSENALFTVRILREESLKRIILVTSPFHQLRTYLAFAAQFTPEGGEIINYYAETDEWHPRSWFFSTNLRKLVASELRRIRRYHMQRQGSKLHDFKG